MAAKLPFIFKPFNSTGTVEEVLDDWARGPFHLDDSDPTGRWRAKPAGCDKATEKQYCKLQTDYSQRKLVLVAVLDAKAEIAAREGAATSEECNRRHLSRAILAVEAMRQKADGVNMTMASLVTLLRQKAAAALVAAAAVEAAAAAAAGSSLPPGAVGKRKRATGGSGMLAEDRAKEFALRVSEICNYYSQQRSDEDGVSPPPPS